MPNRKLYTNKRLEAQALFDANGRAVAVVNVPPGPAWEVIQIAISTTVTANLTQAATYIGTNESGIFISNTLLGNKDTDSFPNVTVRYGESVCCVWAAGTAGRTARMTVVYNEVDQ